MPSYSNDPRWITNCSELATAPAPIARFEVGRTYSCRSLCDYDCVFTFTIVKRTEKTVTLGGAGDRAGTGGTVRRKVRVWQGAEQCDPHGRYSMSPVLSADGRP